MIAALGMYDTARTAEANDLLWALIREGLRAHGIVAPDGLTRGEGAYMAGWLSPDLVLAQCCGYPFRAHLMGRVTLIGAGDHRLPHTPAGQYHSVLVARSDDPRQSFINFDGADFAWNDDLSQSGWAAPAHHAAKAGIRLNPQHRSGSHRASARAVSVGKADLAAIDAVTWAIMAEDGSGDSAGLKEITRTMPTPALPFIAGRDLDQAAVFAALEAAIDALSPADQAVLHLYGLVPASGADYRAVPDPGPPGPSARPSARPSD
ncbi:phosphate/phosphite/phosphonate ABC transporter substrate-binding protein [Pseudogemmobacter bohemicus]|uniref:phosphate/phosphite/phosphonate ABC transporter substrate-binding protein n=1 Tax=Pseudogemmobacter bohemicus TaxID=2250708 RepID=UPI000DD41D97|nr:PhnD/SsuA/transferrin family substrate-binding protein [Pseudogemmobacter bohemicus]